MDITLTEIVTSNSAKHARLMITKNGELPKKYSFSLERGKIEIPEREGYSEDAYKELGYDFSLAEIAEINNLLKSKRKKTPKKPVTISLFDRHINSEWEQLGLPLNSWGADMDFDGYYRSVSNGLRYSNEPISEKDYNMKVKILGKCYEIELINMKFIVFKTESEIKAGAGLYLLEWMVVEPKSGMKVGEGRTKAKAVQNASDLLEKNKDKIQDFLDEHFMKVVAENIALAKILKQKKGEPVIAKNPDDFFTELRALRPAAIKEFGIKKAYINFDLRAVFITRKSKLQMGYRNEIIALAKTYYPLIDKVTEFSA